MRKTKRTKNQGIFTWYLLLPLPLLRRTRHMMTRKAARQEKKRIAMKRPLVIKVIKAMMILRKGEEEGGDEEALCEVEDHCNNGEIYCTI